MIEGKIMNKNLTSAFKIAKVRKLYTKKILKKKLNYLYSFKHFEKIFFKSFIFKKEYSYTVYYKPIS